MSIPPFRYKDLFILVKDETKYYLLSSKYVSTTSFEGRKILKVEPEGLTLLAQTAIRDCNFFMRTKHQ
jgi:fumarate hydratase class I